MAETLTPITDIANSSIDALVALVNAIVGVIGGDCVTANGAANGALTVGNSYVSGIFGASVMVGGALRGGNVQTSATLPVYSNVFLTNGGILTIGNTTSNASISQSTISIPVGNFTNATIGYLPQSNITFANTSIADIELVNVAAGSNILDTWPLATYKTAEYLVQARDNSANNHEAIKLLVTHDGVNPISTEYAKLLSNNAVATFAFSTNTTSMILTAITPSTNTTIRTVRTILNA